MGRVKGSKSRIFLAELMIDVLFFTVAAAICLSIFAKAYQMSSESREKNQAVIYAQQAAECFKASGEEGLLSVLGAAKDQNGIYVIYYDNNWAPLVNEQDSVYVMKISTVMEDGMATAKVSISRKDTAVFEIEVKKYEG